VSAPAIVAAVLWIAGAIAIRVAAARSVAREARDPARRGAASPWYAGRVLGTSALVLWGLWNLVGIAAVALAVVYFPP
jgi:hypothetical protein